MLPLSICFRIKEDKSLALGFVPFTNFCQGKGKGQSKRGFLSIYATSKEIRFVSEKLKSRIFILLWLDIGGVCMYNNVCLHCSQNSFQKKYNKQVGLKGWSDICRNRKLMEV